jgi:hypothetical protein
MAWLHRAGRAYRPTTWATESILHFLKAA